MARLDQPIRKVAAVFVKRSSNGTCKYIREPYNIVSLNYGDGTEIKTYMEPVCGRPLSASEREELYDEVRFYDNPPFPKSRIGYAA